MILLSFLTISLPLLAYPLAAEWQFKAIHDFHSALTEARYNPQTQKLECISRFFQDDFELAIRKHSLLPQFTLETNTKANALYENYLKANLKILQENYTAPIEVIGSELEEDVILVYYEIPVQLQKPLQITFTALLELYPDQINFFYLYNRSDKKVFQFIKNQSQITCQL
ncbi:MAG: hypothetical protein NZ108_07850 [Bacteroidia bacterium]|nr:hypothetical protein [Bacteroidia bacterium]